MNKMKSRAELEFELLEKSVPNAIILPFKKEIIALYEAFMSSGQSGGSAPFVASEITNSIKKLMMFETLVPLTGEDDEWVEVSDTNEGKTMFQNIRDGGVFKCGKDSKAYFIDAIVFDGDVGGRFTGNASVSHNGENIRSSQYIKEFPFTPKTFYVDVIDHRWQDKEGQTPSDDGDWWTHTIKDSSQLEEVFKYYDRREWKE